MELNHWNHEHPLVLSEEKYDDVFVCDICLDNAVGLCYCCTECPFILHKCCAELPPRVDYELHLHHNPLALVSSQKLPPEYFCELTCEICLSKNKLTLVYCCPDCCFFMHAGCARLPRKITFEYADRDSSIARKELFLRFLDSKPYPYCFCCEKTLSRTSYTTEGTYIFDGLHIQCAMLSKTVKHERHYHDLTLHVPIEKDLQYDECYCDVCETTRDPKDWVYYCAEHELAAHLSCGIGLDGLYRGILASNFVYTNKREEHNSKDMEISLLDIKESHKKYEEQLLERMTLGNGKGLDEQKLLQHFSHEHPLALLDEPCHLDIYCELCQSITFGKTYACDVCCVYMHKRCAELPQKIHHRLHSEHPLALSEFCGYCGYCWVKMSGLRRM